MKEKLSPILLSDFWWLLDSLRYHNDMQSSGSNEQSREKCTMSLSIAYILKILFQRWKYKHWISKQLGIPHPYKISWVRKANEILVSYMCRVSFSIRKHFTCEALCDVIDMDVCHLIFRRTWQFEMGAVYTCTLLIGREES